jgi:methylisocitrate lyase
MTISLKFRKKLLARRKSGELKKYGSMVLPGCFDGVVARMAARKGFEGVYLSGGGTSALTGVPDIGIVTSNDFCSKIKNLSKFSGLPVLSDADTGFADPVSTVHDYILSGAAGLHLEDQVFPKRCGHLKGKELIPDIDFANTIKRCTEAVGNSDNKDFIICARTDARGIAGGSVDNTISRLRLYADSGATMLFPEGLRSADEFNVVSTAIRSSHGDDVFLLANMTEFGVTPQISAFEFGKLDYDVTIYPMGLFRIAMRAVDEGLNHLKQNNGFKTYANEKHMLTRDELYNYLKYDPMDMPWDYPSAEIKRDEYDEE